MIDTAGTSRGGSSLAAQLRKARGGDSDDKPPTPPLPSDGPPEDKPPTPPLPPDGPPDGQSC